jgi:hypothetical protein
MSGIKIRHVVELALIPKKGTPDNRFSPPLGQTSTRFPKRVEPEPKIRKPLKFGPGFVAALYTKDAQQHVPTSSNRTFLGAG